MKCSALLSIVAVVLASFSLRGEGKTLSQTNELIRSMLETALIRPRFDANTHVFKAGPRFVASQSDFFRDRDGEWTSDECRGAFDWYLRNISSSAVEYKVGDGARWMENPIASAAISQCEIMNYTNAIPFLLANAYGDYDPSVIETVELLLRWCGTDDEMTDLVTSVITNTVKFTPYERSRVCRAFSDSVLAFDRQADGSGTEHGHAVHPLFEFRRDPVLAVSIDRLTVGCCPGYECSSNRFETAMAIVLSGNASPNCLRHFHSVTNQLLNAAQPLPEVEALRGL